MESPKKIMVPVDLSERSERAIEYAAILAQQSGAELVLATNISLPERAALEEFAKVEHISVADAAELALKRLADQHAPNTATSVVVSYDDSAASGILHSAESCDADAIVMASHGRSGMSRWALGSVAEKIARSAEIPVTIIPVRDV